MLSNVTSLAFETNCDNGRPVAVLVEPGSPNLPIPFTPDIVFKAGFVVHDLFVGTPRKASVVFDVPFLDVNYAINLSGVDARIFTYESKATTGFTINTNANGALSGEVSWTAIKTGESP